MALLIYNYSSLEWRIGKKCGTQSKFAKLIGLSERSVSLKLNNKIGWKQAEIERACNILSIKRKDIPEYFFCVDGSID